MREAAGTALTRLNPSTVAPPAGRYSHGVLVPAGAKLLFISGQVGIEPDGSVPSDFVGQALPASVLVFVAALADPRWVVEVEAIAAQP